MRVETSAKLRLYTYALHAPSGTFGGGKGVTTADQCQQCDASCKTCTGALATECESCKGSATLKDGQCVCPAGENVCVCICLCVCATLTVQIIRCF